MCSDNSIKISITGLPTSDPVLSKRESSLLSVCLVRPNEFLLIEHGEGYVFDVVFEANKNKFIAYDADGERLGELPTAARKTLTDGENYNGRILYFEERGSTTTAMVEIYK